MPKLIEQDKLIGRIDALLIEHSRHPRGCNCSIALQEYGLRAARAIILEAAPWRASQPEFLSEALNSGDGVYRP